MAGLELGLLWKMKTCLQRYVGAVNFKWPVVVSCVPVSDGK